MTTGVPTYSFQVDESMKPEWSPTRPVYKRTSSDMEEAFIFLSPDSKKGWCLGDEKAAQGLDGGTTHECSE